MANENVYSPTISGQIDRIQDSKEAMREAINSYFPEENKINEDETIDSYAAKILEIPTNFNAELVGNPDADSDTYIKAIEQINGVINAQTGGLVSSESSGLMSTEDKAKLDGIEPGAKVNVQSDWNEVDDSSDAYIKNKTHGEALTDIITTGSYTHTNNITHIKHNGSTFELELGVRTQINSGPPAYVTLTSPNTILIEELSSGWVTANRPVTIIDIQKIDVKYLPDDVLNVNVPTPPQSDWGEMNSVLPSYINGRTHWIEYCANEISSPGTYNLDNYGAIYPVIIHFNTHTYEVHEGENRLSWGPPLLVNLSGNILTIDESSYVNEEYKIKVAAYVQKLSPVFIPDTIYSAGTGLSLNETTFHIKPASATELGGIKIGYEGPNQNYPIQLDNDQKAYVNVPIANLVVGSTTYNGTEEVTITKEDLGLTNALIYRGTSSTEITDQGDQTPTITSDYVGWTNGDVVFYNKNEFVWNGNVWEKLGDAVTYKVVQTPVNDPDLAPDQPTLTFVSNIAQDANGVISPTKKSVQAASADQAGIVSTGNQTFSGKKTFNGIIEAANTNGVSWGTNKIKESNGSLYFYDADYNYLMIDNSSIIPRSSNNSVGYIDGISLGATNYRFSQGYFLGEVYSGAGFYETSDARMKNFSTTITCDLDKLSQLPKKYFTWKSDTTNKLHIGTSAQAVQEIYPELVNEDKNGTLSVAYDKLSVVALAAIDKLYEEVKTLQNKNSELEDRISKLEKLLLDGKEL